jgi:F0F1-type ATP synthase assembly protein I
MNIFQINSPKTDKTKERIIKELSPYLNLGWQLAITICLMALLGWWLDAEFNTKPILMIICSVFGIIASMFSFIKTVLDLNKKNK